MMKNRLTKAEKRVIDNRFAEAVIQAVTSEQRRRSVFIIVYSLLIILFAACVPEFLLRDPDWVVLKAGAHEPFPRRNETTLIKPRLIYATVTFDSSCIYDVGSNQQDWNKLIGFGFVGAKDQKIGLPPHRIDGVRIGWRWNPQSQRIELGSYTYIRGALSSKKLDEVKVNEPIDVSIKVDYNKKTYTVMDKEVISFVHDKTIVLKTGVYFGGQEVAPHDMRIKIVE